MSDWQHREPYPVYPKGDPRRKLYGTPRKESMYKLAEMTPVEGCILELGVATGGTAILLYRLAQQREQTLHLFDTFTGIPFSGEYDEVKAGWHAHTNLPLLRELMPEAQFHVGVFPDTLPPDLDKIAFAHIDCDQYESYRQAIHHLLPKLLPGGIMLFDDYNVLYGAQKAVNELIDAADLLRTPEGKAYLVKPA